MSGVAWKCPVSFSYKLDVVLFGERIEGRWFCKFSDKEGNSWLIALPVTPFTCHGSSKRHWRIFPSTAGIRGYFFQNVKKYVVVEMGNGNLYGDLKKSKQNKPRDLSSVLSYDSNIFSDLERVSSPHWTRISVFVETHCQTGCSWRSFPVLALNSKYQLTWFIYMILAEFIWVCELFASG